MKDKKNPKKPYNKNVCSTNDVNDSYDNNMIDSPSK